MCCRRYCVDRLSRLLIYSLSQCLAQRLTFGQRLRAGVAARADRAADHGADVLENALHGVDHPAAAAASGRPTNVHDGSPREMSTSTRISDPSSPTTAQLVTDASLKLIAPLLTIRIVLESPARRKR